MKLSFSTRGWQDLAWDELLEIAIDMGFNGVEVYNLHKNSAMQDRGGPFHLYQTAATIRQLREKKLNIPCFDTSIDLSTDDGAVETLTALFDLRQTGDAEGGDDLLVGGLVHTASQTHQIQVRVEGVGHHAVGFYPKAAVALCHVQQVAGVDGGL